MFCFDHCWSKVRYWDIYLCSYLLLSVLSHEKVVAPHYTGSSSANDCPIDKLPRPWQCCDHQYTIYYLLSTLCYVTISILSIGCWHTGNPRPSPVCTGCPVLSSRSEAGLKGHIFFLLHYLNLPTRFVGSLNQYYEWSIKKQNRREKSKILVPHQTSVVL